jgi:hypothetical protein
MADTIHKPIISPSAVRHSQNLSQSNYDFFCNFKEVEYILHEKVNLCLREYMKIKLEIVSADNLMQSALLNKQLVA